MHWRGSIKSVYSTKPEWWQKENRGFAIGVHHTGFPLGQFIGPAIIAAILVFGTWRQAFLFIPLIGLSIVVIQFFIGTRKNHEKVCTWIRENNLTVPVEEPAVLPAGKKKASLADSFACLKNRNCLLAIALIFGFTWALLNKQILCCPSSATADPSNVKSCS